ncbi:MAG TPA: general secretion pathway protein GspB [Gammaproteobacteria bacterium]|nr:general secretion pathway protein GspB [Gammaproteobacteria bacterium]
MSLILDALRKSERTRQQTLTGQLSASDAAPTRARIPVPWATLIGILLVINAMVLTIIFWRGHTSHSASIAVETRTPVKASAAISTPVYRPQIRSLAAEAAGINSTGTATTAAEPATVPLANSMTTAPVTTPSSIPTSASGPTISTPLSSPINSASADNAPPLDSLPLAFQQSLPPLHLDVHGYAQKPANRFVVINMQRYQTGDTLKEGPKIIAITPQGVVLDYNDQRFLLPRP